MKTINDVLILVNRAIAQNQDTINIEMMPQWFISYSGHVNKMSVMFHKTGWSADKADKGLFDDCEINLSKEDEIQEMYWFIKNRL